MKDPNQPEATRAAPVRIREAVPADAERIVSFNAAMARETEGRELDAERLRRGVAALLEHPDRGRYFVAEPIDSVATGQAGAAPAPLGAGVAASDPVAQLMITFEWSDWRNGTVWWIQSVYVAPGWRRRGVYGALHRDVRRRARESGAVGLRLYVDEDNATARAVYRALGMKPSRYSLFEEMWEEPTGSSR